MGAADPVTVPTETIRDEADGIAGVMTQLFGGAHGAFWTVDHDLSEHEDGPLIVVVCDTFSTAVEAAMCVQLERPTMARYLGKPRVEVVEDGQDPRTKWDGVNVVVSWPVDWDSYLPTFGYVVGS